MSISFDGLDDSINHQSGGTIDSLFDSGGCAMAWVFPNNAGENANARIFNKDSGTLGYLIGFSGDTGSACKVQIAHRFTTTLGNWSTTNTDISSYGAWYHVAVSYNNANTANVPTIWINGVSSAITAATSPSGTRQTDAAQNLIVGNNLTGASGTRSFDGLISMVQQFKAVTLTDGEVLQAMRYPGSVRRGLVLFAPYFNTTAVDYSGNANIGTSSGPTTSVIGPPISGLYYNSHAGDTFGVTSVAASIFTPYFYQEHIARMA